jgi:hypothetical protein
MSTMNMLHVARTFGAHPGSLLEVVRRIILARKKLGQPHALPRLMEDDSLVAV